MEGKGCLLTSALRKDPYFSKSQLTEKKYVYVPYGEIFQMGLYSGEINSEA